MLPGGSVPASDLPPPKIESKEEKRKRRRVLANRLAAKESRQRSRVAIKRLSADVGKWNGENRVLAKKNKELREQAQMLSRKMKFLLRKANTDHHRQQQMLRQDAQARALQMEQLLPSSLLENYDTTSSASSTIMMMPLQDEAIACTGACSNVSMVVSDSLSVDQNNMTEEDMWSNASHVWCDENH